MASGCASGLDRQSDQPAGQDASPHKGEMLRDAGRRGVLTDSVTGGNKASYKIVTGL